MKTKSYSYISVALIGLAIAAMAVPRSARADAYWGGVIDTNWANLANWGGTGDPANAAGATIINLGNNPCVVFTPGNTTSGDCYISIGVGLTILSGGQLTVAANLITGQWGNSLSLDVSGQLTINGYLLTGNGGFDGAVNIYPGGTVQSAALSMNTAGGAKINIVSTNATYATQISQLGNVNYWIAHNAITANGNAPGWAVNINTNIQPGYLVLTAVYTPPTTSINYIFNNGGGDHIWTNSLNWNPVGTPGQYDIANVAGDLSVTLNSGTEGNVNQLLVGNATAAGSVNFNTNCSVSFRSNNISVLVGGSSNSDPLRSTCVFNGGSVVTVGDLVLGGSGGRVDARHYGGACSVGGTLRLGSYLYSPGTAYTNVSLRLIGGSGNIGAGAIELGDAGTLSYEFNGGGSIKTLGASGAATISTGAALVVDGTGYSGLTGDLTLLQGSSLTGTFNNVMLTNFPQGVTASLSYTATRLKLSLVVTQPNFGLNVKNLGGGTNQIIWAFGNIQTATNVNGPWQLDQCATSPLIQVAGSGKEFFRGVLFGLAYKYDNESGDNLWTTAINWNPDGTPGPLDDTVVASGKSVYITSNAGTVGSVTVGDTTGNGALNINPGGAVVYTNPCQSVVIGGATASPNNYASYYRHSNGSLVTAGDFVVGRNGGKVDGQFAGPGILSVGGTFRLGSVSAGYSFFNIPGNAGGGTMTAGNLEVGGAGELQYNFSGGNHLLTIQVSGFVSLLSGSTLTINGSGYSNGTGTYNYTLIQGGSRTGTFTTVNVSGFPTVGTTATVGYSGGNVTLQVVVP